MTNKSLLLGAAAGLAITIAAGSAADAQATGQRASGDAALRAEVEALKAQVQALQAWHDSEAAKAAATQAQLQQVQSELAATQARADAAEAKVQAQIETIPGAVQSAVDASKPKTDKLYIKGVSLQFGGFVAAETVYRSVNEEADIASSFGGIPYPNNPVAHTNEFRFSARQSRVSALAQGDATPTVHLTGYGEVDFLGAAQTANSNETNSFTPRLRVFYSQIDWDQTYGGLHLLAGQNWSLATLYSNGLNPRSEAPPLSIDAQYVPGFIFTRQPQVRFTADFNKQVWLALSLENPQTTYYNSGQYDPGTAVLTNGPAGSGFNSVNTLSLNDVPDIIGKVAVQEDLSGHLFHAELFGLYRDFYSRLYQNKSPNGNNQNVTGGGIGGGIIFGVVPKALDLEVSGAWGDGIGRYGASQLPDATVSVDGTVHPVEEWALLVGLIGHVGSSLDLYAYWGEENEARTAFTNPAIPVYNGWGNEAYNNTGCFMEGGTCVGNTNYVDQATVGFWHRPYIGSFGKIQWGIQYSYTQRRGFDGMGVEPKATDNMVFTSIRYYPF